MCNVQTLVSNRLRFLRLRVAFGEISSLHGQNLSTVVVDEVPSAMLAVRVSCRLSSLPILASFESGNLSIFDSSPY